jgi:hypothetical protein
MMYVSDVRTANKLLMSDTYVGLNPSVSRHDTSLTRDGRPEDLAEQQSEIRERTDRSGSYKQVQGDERKRRTDDRSLTGSQGSQGIADDVDQRKQWEADLQQIRSRESQPEGRVESQRQAGQQQDDRQEADLKKARSEEEQKKVRAAERRKAEELANEQVKKSQSEEERAKRRAEEQRLEAKREEELRKTQDEQAAKQAQREQEAQKMRRVKAADEQEEQKARRAEAADEQEAQKVRRREAAVKWHEEQMRRAEKAAESLEQVRRQQAAAELNQQQAAEDEQVKESVRRRMQVAIPAYELSKSLIAPDTGGTNVDGRTVERSRQVANFYMASRSQEHSLEISRQGYERFTSSSQKVQVLRFGSMQASLSGRNTVNLYV